MTVPKFHRDARSIPTDIAERKARVRWCCEHRLWHYVVKHHVPRGGTTLWEQYELGDEVKECLFGGFHERVEIDPNYVDPATERIEDDDSRNTAFRVWIEAGGWQDESDPENHGPHAQPIEPEGGWNDHNRWIGCHDPELDCGAVDLESAILELAQRVEFYYGDGHLRLKTAPRRCELERVEGVPDDAPAREQYRSTCAADLEGYCAKCGFRVES